MPDATLTMYPAPTVADMREFLDNSLTGKGAISHVFAFGWVTLTRDGPVWELSILDTEQPVTQATCDRVATEAGAPSLDTWRREANGHKCTAQWVEWVREA